MTLAYLGLAAEPWAMTKHALRELARTPDLALKLPSEGDLAAWNRVLMPIAGPVTRSLDGGSGRAIVIDGVACIPIIGPIFPRDNFLTRYGYATSITGLQRDLFAATADDGVNAIVPVIDSPGGAVSGVNGLADQLFAVRAVKPMAAHAIGTAASGAYWLGSQAERFTVERTGIVGSIGVVVCMPKQTDPDAEGNLWFDIVSTNAPNKRPDPSTDDGLAEIVATLDALEGQFVADVARGRGVTADKVTADFGRGGTRVGADAQKVGMVDGISTLDAVIARMARVGKSFRKGQQAAR